MANFLLQYFGDIRQIEKIQKVSNFILYFFKKGKLPHICPTVYISGIYVEYKLQVENKQITKVVANQKQFV